MRIRLNSLLCRSYNRLRVLSRLYAEISQGHPFPSHWIIRWVNPQQLFPLTDDVFLASKINIRAEVIESMIDSQFSVWRQTAGWVYVHSLISCDGLEGRLSVQFLEIALRHASWGWVFPSFWSRRQKLVLSHGHASSEISITFLGLSLARSAFKNLNESSAVPATLLSRHHWHVVIGIQTPSRLLDEAIHSFCLEWRRSLKVRGALVLQIIPRLHCWLSSVGLHCWDCCSFWEIISQIFCLQHNFSCLVSWTLVYHLLRRHLNRFSSRLSQLVKIIELTQ